jgi:hypothetical protein
MSSLQILNSRNRVGGSSDGSFRILANLPDDPPELEIPTMNFDHRLRPGEQPKHEPVVPAPFNAYEARFNARQEAPADLPMLELPEMNFDRMRQNTKTDTTPPYDRSRRTIANEDGGIPTLPVPEMQF